MLETPKSIFGKIFKVKITVPGFEKIDDGFALAVSDFQDSGLVELLLVTDDSETGKNDGSKSCVHGVPELAEHIGYSNR